MRTRKATHTGICQDCGRRFRLEVDRNSMAGGSTGVVATSHTVPSGGFACQGAGKIPVTGTVRQIDKEHDKP